VPDPGGRFEQPLDGVILHCVSPFSPGWLQRFRPTERVTDGSAALRTLEQL